MNIRKAVITCAGPGQQHLPLHAIVDQDGVEKSALHLILDEVTSAGVDEVCLVVLPGTEKAYRGAAGPHDARLTFVQQPQPRGYGCAVHLANAFTGKEPFLHLVSDHLYISTETRRCAEQVIAAAQSQGCAVSAVQATREHMLAYFGTIAARRIPRRNDLYEVLAVLEKPTPTEAEQVLHVPGLRAGFYLCLFGIHVFTPTVMDILSTRVRADDGPVQLSPILDQLARQERYLALEVSGRRYDIGVKYGLLMAQLALALHGRDRDHVLAGMLEMLALRSLDEGARP